MAKFSKSNGAWLDKSTLRNGDIVKIVTEAAEQDNNQGGKQIVAKVRVKGGDPEPKNISINAATKNALIDAFGDESQTWMDKLLTVHTEKTMIAGKRGIALYLLPEGYEIGEDASGYVVVIPQGIAVKLEAIQRESDEDVADSIPF